MKCCDVEPMIDRSYTVIENGQKYHIVVLKCINPQCSNYKKTWEERLKAD